MSYDDTCEECGEELLPCGCCSWDGCECYEEDEE